MNNNFISRFLTPKFLIPGIVLSLVGFAVLWYLVSPLFINTRVNEALPASAQAVIAKEPPAMKTAVADQTMHPMNEVMPLSTPAAGQSSTPTLLQQASFYNVVHEGKGKAEIFRLSDGMTILRLEDFQVLNGPDLHVYLVPAATIAPNIGQDLPGYVDLGKLKGNQGAQNYTIPAGVQPANFRSVVIWCQPFKVPFIAATFK